jgi:hypothetical protein
VRKKYDSRTYAEAKNSAIGIEEGIGVNLDHFQDASRRFSSIAKRLYKRSKAREQTSRHLELQLTAFVQPKVLSQPQFSGQNSRYGAGQQRRTRRRQASFVRRSRSGQGGLSRRHLERSSHLGLGSSSSAAHCDTAAASAVKIFV